MPISPLIPIPSAGDRTTAQPLSSGPRRSAAQIAAAREAARLESAADTAEWDMLEWIKRRESLEKQIELEKVLLQAAHESNQNLERALAAAEGDLERKVTEKVDQREIRDRERSVALVERLLADARNEIEERTLYIDSLERRLDKLALEGESIGREAKQARKKAESSLRHSSWLASPLSPEQRVEVGSTSPNQNADGRCRCCASPRGAAPDGAPRSTNGRTAQPRQPGSRNQPGRHLGVQLPGRLHSDHRHWRHTLGSSRRRTRPQHRSRWRRHPRCRDRLRAQNLMRDYFTGFMILLEDQYEIGDLVTIGTITGRVERVNMRVTVLRDVEGRVHFIPNGEIKSVTNRTYEWGRALVEVPVAYNENIDRALEVLLQAAKDLQVDEEWSEYVTADPNMMGVDKFTESGVILKLTLQTRPDKIFPVRRELLRRIKNKVR